MRGQITLNEKEQKRLMILNKGCQGEITAAGGGLARAKFTADAPTTPFQATEL
jgi:hypothetical protein